MSGEDLADMGDSEGGEDARGRPVGLATSPLGKKIVEEAFVAGAGRVDKFIVSVRLFEAPAIPVPEGGGLDNIQD